MKGIFSGRQIKDLKGRGQKITRSQTASNALTAITDKYGGIVDNAHYFHVGKGVWKKYSIDSDRTRTGKIAPSKVAWAERPNKFDWEGIDTKESKKVVTNKKPRFSVTTLAKGKMTGRKGDGMKLTGRAVTKKIERPATSYNDSLINDISALKVGDFALFKHVNKVTYGGVVKSKGSVYIKILTSSAIYGEQIIKMKAVDYIGHHKKENAWG